MLDLSQICSKICPKCFQEFPENFTYYASHMFLLCLHYAPKLSTILSIVMEMSSNDCSIRAFHYKVTVLLESIDLRSYVSSLNVSPTALLESIDLL